MLKLNLFKIIAGAGGALLLAAIFWHTRSASQPAVFYQKPAPAAHHAKNPSASLNKIDIKAVYFVPSDAQGQEPPDWRENLENALKQVRDFYLAQFGGASAISVEIYPRPVVGSNATDFYNGADTRGGNPHALLAVRRELGERILSPQGDMYAPGFSGNQPGSFLVLGIFYQGVGSAGLVDGHSGNAQEASGNLPPAFLTSADYLTGDQYSDFGVTFVAHEFGHTLGFQDHYDLDTGQPFSDDLMGAGRFRPLNYTFISDDDKKSLGLQP